VEYVAPRNNVEIQLVRILEQVLEKNKIGIEDDFFSLGGNSIRAMRVISELQKHFDIKLELTNFFEDPTVSGIAIEISNHLWQKEEKDNTQVTEQITI
jgi:acyl carrier protein